MKRTVILSSCVLFLLAGCQPTTDEAPAVSSSSKPQISDAIIALMKLGPEYVVLYDTRQMDRAGIEVFARDFCAKKGSRFKSLEHRPIAHPDQLPNSGKAGFECT